MQSRELDLDLDPDSTTPAQRQNDLAVKGVPNIAVSIFVLSNHNSFRVLFYKIASVYFISEYNILAWKWPAAAQGTGTVPIVSAHFRSIEAHCRSAVCVDN